MSDSLNKTERSKNTQNETFVSRWSRRKSQTETQQAIVEADIQGSEISSEISNDKLIEKTEDEKLAELNALTDEDMPDVATLGEDSEYSGFMSTNVSEELRKLALRKLFHGKGYNFRDGLDEYDEDYTYFEKLDPSVITADMKHMMDVEAKKLLAEAEAEDDVDNNDLDSEIETFDDELEVASEETTETELESHTEYTGEEERVTSVQINEETQESLEPSMDAKEKDIS